MKKNIVFVVLVLLSVFMFADEAVFKSVKGKVEYSSDGLTWFPAEPYKILKKGDYISTSFKSSASIVVNDSIINIKPLTRMSLEEITNTSEGPQTALYLVSGKVQVEVKPAIKGEITTFNVKSAMATASVRGTGFIFDGENILVNHGSVQLMDPLGISRSFNGGEYGTIGKRGKIPEAIVVKKPTKPLLKKEATPEDIENAVTEFLESLLENPEDVLAAYTGDLVSDTSPLGEQTIDDVLDDIIQMVEEDTVSEVAVTIK